MGPVPYSLAQANCADFLAGAHLDNSDPQILLNSISRYYKFLPDEQQLTFLDNLREKAS
jgi:hypothetical protein